MDSRTANAFVRRVHYSGKVVNNSQLHVGVYLLGDLEGVMSFGPSLDKRKMLPLVEGTPWNGFLELNRLAFTDRLPRNSESRALAVCFRLFRRWAPHVKWIVSFADACQCGDGTIYRAAGFILTGIKKNDQIWVAPDGEKAARLVKTNLNPGSGRDKYVEKYGAAGARESRTSLTDGRSKREQARASAVARDPRHSVTKGKGITHAWNLRVHASSTVHTGSDRPGIGGIQAAAFTNGASSMKAYIEAGFKPLPGFQLRYIKFLDPTWRPRLTVPELPYSAIAEAGAKMYKGQAPEALLEDAPPVQGGEGGASPTPALHLIT